MKVSLEEIDVICVDVFDTCVLRRPICESRRLLLAARAAVAHPLLLKTRPILAKTIWNLRLQIKRLAYRAAAIEGLGRDVRLIDMVNRLAKMLSLPAGSAAVLAQLELEEDIASVEPNKPFIKWLAEARSSGKRVIALSDTHYSVAEIRILLSRHGVLPCLDHVYTSADLGVTKQGGDAFDLLLVRENILPNRILHIGDNPVADYQSPLSRGFKSYLMPRSKWSFARHKLDSVLFALSGSSLPTKQGRFRKPVPSTPGLSAAEAFGATVVGPIVAEYCLRQWLYMASLQSSDAVALFCARGGLRMALAARTVYKQLNLDSPLPTGDLMISRLVAARAALLKNSARAYEELEREFNGNSCATVARALAATSMSLHSDWDAAFTAENFRNLLQRAPDAKKLIDTLEDQNSLFERHLDTVCLGKKDVLLCDTGLFGSTQRLLEHGFPDRNWQSVMFARANYKHFEVKHFRQATGLEVERDVYSVLDSRSSILRYWQFVEDLFEPPLDSVKSFRTELDGSVRSNLQVDDWQIKLDGVRGTVFFGVIDYLRTLKSGDVPSILEIADDAWFELANTILFPSKRQAEIFMVENRSIDFGRSEKINSPSKLRSFRQALWKEGMIARHLGIFRWPAQLAVQTMYILRDALTRIRTLIDRRISRTRA